jgi:hypothetical protein
MEIRLDLLRLRFPECLKSLDRHGSVVMGGSLSVASEHATYVDISLTCRSEANLVYTAESNCAATGIAGLRCHARTASIGGGVRTVHLSVKVN